MKKLVSIFAVLLVCSSAAYAQYNAVAGKNAITETVTKKEVKADGSEVITYEEVRVESDNYGNAKGNQYDLAVDGAFDGQTIVVLHLYTGEGFDFELPKKALQEKGFSVYRFINKAPEPAELKEALDKGCQLWIISDRQQKLNSDHVGLIKAFFESGKGVYIWGDNEPYYSDANYVAQELIGASMTGNLLGNQTVGLQDGKGTPGLLTNHLVSTGLEYIYEGITIATIQDPNQVLSPLIYGSAGNMVTAIYERDEKRLIIDGGFTRLFVNWDTAGTGRYVKNAAAWLVNYERFGDDVLGKATEKDAEP